MYKNHKVVYFKEGILDCELVDEKGARVGVFDNLDSAMEFVFDKNRDVKKEEDFILLKFYPNQLKSLVEESWWEDFKNFTSDGITTPEFDRHLEVCTGCTKAVDLCIAKSSVAMHLIGKVMRKEFD